MGDRDFSVAAPLSPHAWDRLPKELALQLLGVMMMMMMMDEFT